jgi:hypothetical protein
MAPDGDMDSVSQFFSFLGRPTRSETRLWAVSLLIHTPALYAQFPLIPSSNGSQSGEIRFSTPANDEIKPLQRYPSIR